MGRRSKWDLPPKVENDHVEVWDFQLQIGRTGDGEPAGHCQVDKGQKRAVINVAIT